MRGNNEGVVRLLVDIVFKTNVSVYKVSLKWTYHGIVKLNIEYKQTIIFMQISLLI